MNTPATHRPPSRLAICGWDEHALVALEALEATGAFRGAAIGDRSGAALVRARRETALPCYQRVSEMVRAENYDAILFTDPHDIPAEAMVAAARGAHLLLLGESMPGTALLSAASAATAHGVPLTLLQPSMHDPGIEDLAASLGEGPRYLDITVEAPADAALLLRTAVAHASRLLPHIDGTARGTAWGGDEPRAVAAEVHTSNGQCTIRARHAPSTFVRIAGESAAGAVDLMFRDGAAEFRFASPAGDHLRYSPAVVDHWTIEAYRAAEHHAYNEHSGHLDDRAGAEAQGTLLDAIERAIATGEAQSTACCRRPELRVLPGGGRDDSTRSASLRLVVS